jgi:hypothetical protein
MRRFLYFSIAILILSGIVFDAQGQVPENPDTIRPESREMNRWQKLTQRKPMVAAGIVLNTAGILYTGYNWWWKGNYHPFSVKYEGFFNNYSLGVDKAGHFYISYLYFHAIHDLMRWAGYKPGTALWVGAAIPALYAITIEVADGYTSYHFSFDDLASNLAGIGLGILQKKVPYANYFKVKWSYFPSAFAPWRDANLALSDDYDGHIYWLTADLHNALPKKMGKYWPPFLNIAAGYGVSGASFGSTKPMERKFLIGLDYNLSHFKFKNKTLNTIKNLADFFHYPAPAWRKVGSDKASLGFPLN